MRYDLARMVAEHRRTNVTLRAIVPTVALREDLLRILVQVPREWAPLVKARLMPRYAAVLASLTKDAQDDQENRQLADELALLLLLMRQRVTTWIWSIAPWVIGAEEWHRRQWAAAVKAGGNVDVSTILSRIDVEGNIQVGIRRNALAIETLNNYVIDRTGTLIWTGVAQRIPVNKMAEMIDNVIDIARRKAAATALYQTEALTGDLDRARQEEAGLTGYDWLHSLLPNPREWHLARDGHHYEWDHPPFDGHPGTQPGCRCRARAVINVEAIHERMAA